MGEDAVAEVRINKNATSARKLGISPKTAQPHKRKATKKTKIIKSVLTAAKPTINQKPASSRQEPRTIPPKVVISPEYALNVRVGIWTKTAMPPATVSVLMESH